jgi:hypothetical protein
VIAVHLSSLVFEVVINIIKAKINFINITIDIIEFCDNIIPTACHSCVHRESGGQGDKEDLRIMTDRRREQGQ